MATLSSNLQNILDNRLRYLPPLVGQAINSIDWSAKLIDIGHTYGLHVDEMEDFQGVVLKSMIGIIPPESFETELISALAVSPTDADKIINDINLHIFEPIHTYVINGGQAPDPLKQAGIEIETEGSADQVSVEGPSPASLDANYAEQPQPLPESEPSARFEDFFITTPTTTNHSLGGDK